MLKYTRCTAPTVNIKVCDVNIVYMTVIFGHVWCISVLLEIGTLLNLVQEFGNRRPLICSAGGQRCPSLLCLFVCFQIDACVFAALYRFQQRQAEVLEHNLCVS